MIGDEAVFDECFCGRGCGYGGWFAAEHGDEFGSVPEVDHELAVGRI